MGVIAALADAAASAAVVTLGASGASASSATAAAEATAPSGPDSPVALALQVSALLPHSSDADYLGISTRMVAAVLVFAAVALPGRSRRAVRCRLGRTPRLRHEHRSAMSEEEAAAPDSHLQDMRHPPLDGQPRQSGRWPNRPLALLGRRLGAAIAVEPEDEVLLGTSALLTTAAIALSGPFGALAVAIAAAALLRIRCRVRSRDREMLIERGLPEAVDLLGLVIAAGFPTAAALRSTAPWMPEPFRSELAEVIRRSTAGEPLVESVRRLPLRLGPSVAPLVYAMTAAEVDGVPLQPALERVGDEAHRRRRVRAEEAARRVPVFMLFPLVFCILPAFCLLTVVPLLSGAMADLRLPG